MESIIGEYTEDETYLCPICGHEIENLEEVHWDPCEHVTACYVDVACDWEILDDDLRDKYEADVEACDFCEDEDGNPLEEPEVDPHNIEEWGVANIEADLCVTLSDSGVACGPCCSTTYYFFTKD